MDLTELKSNLYKIILLTFVVLVVSCHSRGGTMDHYDHDQTYVNMMLDLTIASKIHTKTHYSSRSDMMDTVIYQIEQIHGRSIEDFDEYLQQVTSNPKVYEEFLDSVNVARQRLDDMIKTNPSEQEAVQETEG